MNVFRVIHFSAFCMSHTIGKSRTVLKYYVLPVLSAYLPAKSTPTPVINTFLFTKISASP